MLLGKIPPLHFMTVGMTCRWVIPFNHTGCICNVAGGRLPPLHAHRYVISFNHTKCIHYVACGDESSPLHWVYRISGDTILPHRLYPQRGGRLIAAPTGAVPFIRTGYNHNAAGTAHRPFPPYFNEWSEMNNVGRSNNCQLSIQKNPTACPRNVEKGCGICFNTGPPRRS